MLDDKEKDILLQKLKDFFQEKNLISGEDQLNGLDEVFIEFLWITYTAQKKKGLLEKDYESWIGDYCPGDANTLEQVKKIKEAIEELALSVNDGLLFDDASLDDASTLATNPYYPLNKNYNFFRLINRFHLKVIDEYFPTECCTPEHLIKARKSVFYEVFNVFVAQFDLEKRGICALKEVERFVIPKVNNLNKINAVSKPVSLIVLRDKDFYIKGDILDNPLVKAFNGIYGVNKGYIKPECMDNGIKFTFPSSADVVKFMEEQVKNFSDESSVLVDESSGERVDHSKKEVGLYKVTTPVSLFCGKKELLSSFSSDSLSECYVEPPSLEIGGTGNSMRNKR